MGNAPKIQESQSGTLLLFEHAQVIPEVSQHCEFQRPHQHMVLFLRLLPDLFELSIPQLQSAYLGLLF